MIRIVKANIKDLNKILDVRYEAIKEICNLEERYSFSDEFMENTKKYYQNAEQTTVLALDEENVVGCATLCYIWLIPTFNHPGGKRGHLMNVYTNRRYRRQGIAYQMLRMLIDDARGNCATELSLDATEVGRSLYQKCGFVASTDGMVLNLN